MQKAHVPSLLLLKEFIYWCAVPRLSAFPSAYIAYKKSDLQKQTKKHNNNKKKAMIFHFPASKINHLHLPCIGSTDRVLFVGFLVTRHRVELQHQDHKAVKTVKLSTRNEMMMHLFPPLPPPIHPHRKAGSSSFCCCLANKEDRKAAASSDFK